MEYLFKVNVNTDGDFCFPFVPSGMQDYDDDSYVLAKSYYNRDDAIKDIDNICTFLKEQIVTSRDYVREYWNETIDHFLKRLHASSKDEHEYVAAYMHGNYEGTEFVFEAVPSNYRISFPVTDEEYELLQKNGNDITIGMVKKAVLALFRG